MRRFNLKHKCSGLIAALMLFIAAPGMGAELESKKPLQVFFVRHADKTDNSANAKLSADGKERVTALVRVLGDAQLDCVHSTDFARTRSTATPVASSHRVKVQTYDRYGNSSLLIEKLRNAGGRHLVVGHRSSLPGTIRSLGGELGPRIGADEFDRLYLVSVDSDGRANTILMRYGKQRNGRASSVLETEVELEESTSK